MVTYSIKFICDKVVCSSSSTDCHSLLAPFFILVPRLLALKDAAWEDVWFVLQERLMLTGCLPFCSLVPSKVYVTGKQRGSLLPLGFPHSE